MPKPAEYIAGKASIAVNESQLVMEGKRLTEWAKALETLRGSIAMWADFDGWHEDAPPDDPPVGATHLWAQTSDRLFRARFHPNGDVTVATLHLGPSSESLPSETERVDTLIYQALGWNDKDAKGRISQAVERNDSVTGGTFEVYEVLGEMPISFVRRLESA